VVVAESGFVRWQLALPLGKGKGRTPGCLPVLEAMGGEFLTQVPGSALLKLGPPQGAGDARAAVAERVGTIPGIRVEGDAHVAVVTATGRAVHSSVAEQGDNAIWRLSTAAAKLSLCPGGVASMLELVRERFAGDNWGQKLGLGYRHPVMGRLLVAPTVLRLEEGEARLSINMRRPAGMENDAFGRELDRALARLKRVYPTLAEPKKGRYVGDAALADTSGVLVPTLVGIYRELTGDKVSQPLSIRGGTYARLFPGAVSFGPALPGHEYRGHAPDEYITVDAIQLVARSVLEAMLRLDAVAGRL
jgi:acetylornithine deacetylase/succinyl-diaminopimelate desuccinylase-like protein